MNKVVIAVVLAVIGLGAVGAAVAVNSKSNDTAKQVSDIDHTNMSDEEMKADNSSKSDPNEIKSGMVSVDIKDFAFATPKLKIKKGTKVTWTNQDSAKHDVTVDNGDSEAFMGSELLAKGESYDFTFNTIGTYSYNCSPHPYMKASVEVVE